MCVTVGLPVDQLLSLGDKINILFFHRPNVSIDHHEMYH